MDVQTVKSALVRELSSRIAISGGPEVFRRLLVQAPVELVNTALQELVSEGWLKRTELRVGSVYHYPPNVKSSQDIVNRALSGAPATRVARPAPARPAAGAAARPAAAPAVPAPAPGIPTGPVRARKKSQMSPEELAAHQARRAAQDSGEADAPAGTAAGTTATSAVVPPAATGPVRARKKSQMSPEELEALKAQAAAKREAGAAPAPAATPAPEPAPAAATGPIRARKKSQMSAEDLETLMAQAAAKRQAAAPAPEPVVEVPPAAPAAATGPIRARKKSELSAEDLEALKAEAAAKRAAAAATAPVVEPPAAAPSPAPAVPTTFSGPVRARKKSQLDEAG